jgi:hypothetical protein
VAPSVDPPSSDSSADTSSLSTVDAEIMLMHSVSIRNNCAPSFGGFMAVGGGRTPVSRRPDRPI